MKKNIKDNGVKPETMTDSTKEVLSPPVAEQLKAEREANGGYRGFYSYELTFAQKLAFLDAAAISIASSGVTPRAAYGKAKALLDARSVWLTANGKDL